MINIIVGIVVGTVQNIRVEAVRIENVLIFDGEYHHTSAYLVLGNLQTEYLSSGKVSFGITSTFL